MKINELFNLNESKEQPWGDRKGQEKAAFKQGYEMALDGKKSHSTEAIYKAFGDDNHSYVEGFRAGSKAAKAAKKSTHYSDDKFGERHARDSSGHLD